MIFLKNFLKNKKPSTDLSLPDKNKDLIVHTIEFDKTFANEDAEKYLSDNNIKSYKLVRADDEGPLLAHLINKQQRSNIKDSVTEIDGVKLFSSNIKAYKLGGNNGKVPVVDLFNCMELEDGDDELPFVIELAKTIRGNHSWYGEVEITQDQIRQMRSNFSTRAHGIDIAINLDHNREEAVGWVEDINSINDDNNLLGAIKWNRKGLDILANKEYRYISPEIDFDYTHHLTEKDYGTVLTGAALTNYPFLQMGPLVDMSKKKNKEVSTKKRSIKMDDEKELEYKTKISNLELSLKDSTIQNKELNAQVSKLQGLIDKAISDAKYQKLFSEGKITAAQLEQLKEGKDPLDVLAMNVSLSATQKGTSTANDEEVDLTDAQKKAMLDLGCSKEYYLKFLKRSN